MTGQLASDNHVQSTPADFLPFVANGRVGGCDVLHSYTVNVAQSSLQNILTEY